MSNISYHDFINFINSQSPDSDIDHTQDWRACAVGDYLKSIGCDPTRDWMPLVDMIADENLDLYDLLCGTMRTQEIVPTYGDLQKWLLS